MNIGCSLLGLGLAAVFPALAGDQPQWGQAWTRNMISMETGLPAAFDPETQRNVEWVARLGTESHSTPVIAGGRVFIGTNNGEPRDPKHQGDRGVLMCFDEQDGRLLWQLVAPKREEDPYFDWPKSGISSPATVEGDRVYLVSNRGEVLCLDAKGFADGDDGPCHDEGARMAPAGQPALTPGPLDADVIWRFDLTSGAGIWSHDAAHSSILIHGAHLYLNTGTGVDNTHKRIRRPDAPSLVVLDKQTGRLVARDQEGIGPRIFHCTWSAPALGTTGGQPAVFFAGGDGVLYAFKPAAPDIPPGVVMKLEKIWQFDCDPDAPKDEVHRYNSNRREGPSNIYGMPVVAGGRLYVAGGGDWFWGKNEAWLKCLDLEASGKGRTPALRWSYPLGRHTMATPAVHQGLVYAADSMRVLHCVDTATGRAVWTHELNGEVWASALAADNKVFIGTRRGDFWVFAAGPEKKILSTIELGAPISATASAANGRLYVATMTHLYALRTRTEGAPPANQ